MNKVASSVVSRTHNMLGQENCLHECTTDTQMNPPWSNLSYLKLLKPPDIFNSYKHNNTNNKYKII